MDDTKLDDLQRENETLRSELSDAAGDLAAYNAQFDRLVSYWRELTGYDKITPPLGEIVDEVLRFAAAAEDKDDEIAELTEQIDELRTEQEWLLAKVRDYE